MKLLGVEKNIINLQDESHRYPQQFTVIDLNSDINIADGADIIFPKLLYIEDYVGPAIDCSIGGYRVMLPLSWCIFIGDEDVSEVEAIPMTSLNAREFSTIVTNPIDGFRHYFLDIRIYDVLTEYEWILPKIKNGQCVAYPITNDSNNPLCVYVSHSTTKIPTSLSPTDFM
ncbi:hypothetical protein PBI_SCTP2_145 [Salicola phage SCTP-2]|nr:hypothetical protein PBI_SCTP2_145 [Salicola phage SCTP-2]